MPPISPDPPLPRSAPAPLAEFRARLRAGIRVVLTDIDDTLTTDGHLTAAAYLPRPETCPTYITSGEAGAGFVHFAEALLA